MLKSYFKATYTLSIIGLCYFSFSFSTQAVTFYHYPKWTSGGGVAGTCVHTLSDLAPLSISRTLVVDNHLPNNTELFKWNYGEFIPNISGYCIPNGVSTSPSNTNAWLQIYPTNIFSSAGTGIYPTNISGIGIKIYYKYMSKGVGQGSSKNTTILGYNGGWLPPSTPLNIEYQLLTQGISDYYIGQGFYADDNNVTYGRSYFYSSSANYASYALRAVLVKTGSITYTSTPLSIQATIRFGNNLGDGWASIPNVIGSGGITIIPPACRLRGATDYSIDMGRWLHGGPGSLQPGMTLPANGPAKPVNINLECSGSLDNVYFRFEDAGPSPLANRNVSLYDGGGTKIDGVEIEMLYGGSRINVDNSTRTSVGAQGAIKTNPADISFNSQSTVPFTARYVQRSAIQRNGVSYTGAITGRVNMYVTYQ